jgi:hypothetical protein
MANKGWPRSKCINRAEDFSEGIFEHINIYTFYSLCGYIEEVAESNTKITIVFPDDNAVTNEEVKPPEQSSSNLHNLPCNCVSSNADKEICEGGNKQFGSK